MRVLPLVKRRQACPRCAMDNERTTRELALRFNERPCMSDRTIAYRNWAVFGDCQTAFMSSMSSSVAAFAVIGLLPVSA